MYQVNEWHFGHSSFPLALEFSEASSISTRFRKAAISSGAAVMRFQAGHLFNRSKTVSSALMCEKSLPAIGKTHATPNGVRIWSPQFKDLQVSHLNNGNTVISFCDFNSQPVLFELDETQREDFIDLLRNTPEQAQAPANQPQSAISDVVEGV